ncbi:phage tail sheath subtilisin-like domain-containing protein [Psychrobacter aquaticus]|uniref:Major tail sheath protein n=1 Tax=Psychrobacter aquaticus CMS 56 TaxID=1354303 RepID=U4T476_9GAMM|nr:phage tail sheath subtilisin-like domain-containing protein [Psychrobacter aquaticus]ERL56137.1 major tail sheath protein [Psychrobacter aquaticus CMS 56]
MTQFLHGTETIDVSKGTTQVREVRSGIIGLVGTAPAGDVNTITICLSSTDDAQFGAVTSNHTIPASLKSLREQGCGMVMVINVGSNTNTIDVADIIGTTTSEGARTGIQLFGDGYGIYGYDAKILIAPGFSSVPAVAGALDVMAAKIKAVSYIDLPLGFKPTEAVMSRGSVAPLGVEVYQTQSKRIRICYPHRKVFDPVTSGVKLEPSSIAWAGVRARVDREVGYWTSSSNKEIRGTLGLERVISARIDDPDTETNLLNEAGISTMFKSFGTSFLTWGNRTAAFPVINDYENFEQVQRTKDNIEVSIHQSSLPFVDSDIRQPQIDAIVGFVDEYLRVLIMRGAIVGGQAYFDPARNPISQVSQGQIRVGYKFTPIFPMERITYEREVTGEYLLDLKSVNMGGI